MASTLPHPRAHEPVVPQPATANAILQQLRPSRASQSAGLPSLVRYWHLLSLDAPTVALVWTLAFAWIARVHLAAWVLPLNALVVWTVYVGDRLLDARRGLQFDGVGMRDRHWFHWRHRRTLAPMAIAAAAACACIALRWMPLEIWGRDSAVGVASLAYFARVHGSAKTRILSKEMLVAGLFTAGCALPALSLKIIVPFAVFAALAWLNCWAIERWEADGPGPIVATSARLLTLAAAAIAAANLPYHPRVAATLFTAAVSAALLAFLDRRRVRLSPIALRACADLVLLTPAVVLLAWRFTR